MCPPVVTFCNRRCSCSTTLPAGYTITNFARIVPEGLLVFFPSYTVKNKTIEHWQNNNIFQQMEKHKGTTTSKQKSLPQTLLDLPCLPGCNWLTALFTTRKKFSLVTHLLLTCYSLVVPSFLLLCHRRTHTRHFDWTQTILGVCRGHSSIWTQSKNRPWRDIFCRVPWESQWRHWFQVGPTMCWRVSL